MKTKKRIKFQVINRFNSLRIHGIINIHGLSLELKCEATKILISVTKAIVTHLNGVTMAFYDLGLFYRFKLILRKKESLFS